MITIKINGKAQKIKTSWDELTFSEYCKILKLKDDYLQVVSIVSGLDYEILKTATVIGVEQLLPALAFLNSQPPKWEGYINKIGKYELNVNKKGQFNIQFESLAQFEDMRQVIKSVSNIQTLTDAYPKFIAIYLQKIRDGEYSYSKAMEMENEIQNYNACEVITLGGFFFAKLSSLLSGTPKASQKQTAATKKSRPALKASTKSSGSTRR